MLQQRYLVVIQDCEPSVEGPFSTDEERDREARAIVSSRDFQRGANHIFKLDWHPGGPEAISYLNEDLEGAEGDDHAGGAAASAAT